jgi:hypothetical protein
MYVRTYSLFKGGSLSTNNKLTLYKALIRSVMTYTYPTWGYAEDVDLLKSQSLQDRVLRATGNLDRGTPVREMYMLSKFLTCTTI